MFQETLGYDAGQLGSSQFLELVHPDDQSATETTLQKLLSGHPIIDMENRLQEKSGSYRWVQWRSKLNAEGQFIYAAGRDITSRRRLERQLLNIHDRTRREVGHDLHDELGQRLTGLHMIVNQLAHQTERTVGNCRATPRGRRGNPAEHSTSAPFPLQSSCV